ncbi:Malic oxidoreductase [Cryptosporidium hominis]|uniref:Malic enzyme n=1 Tax=Cryptosporidium hominis TaxID=237895 RepID=A0ABX5BC89_CRYHO|nr:malic enzyme [Cryptosporidium hominis TU502]PPS94193.1 Malic oxidoreductase [Cryptosporidium hominis]|eukprot:PPS94193.1 Malic oxidoreductase [Cryptosporidium hominis]
MAPSLRKKPIELKGIELLRNPFYNKGLSFTMEERKEYGLEGLLPAKYETIDEQVSRLWTAINKIDSNIGKYTFLENIRSSSFILFHSLLDKYFKDLAPLVYTPTVGEGCIEFSRNPTIRNWLGSGLYLNKSHKGRIYEILKDFKSDDIEIIVLTDGGRILGLGDLGLNGMGIPMGKLSLYITLGGIDPSKVLPISLDIGTNTNDILNDKYYLGICEKRIDNDEYFPLMDEITKAIFKRWPSTVLQWEDLTTSRAIDILDIYQDKFRCFNDDIQGTASIVLAGLVSSLKIAGKDFEDQRILICGAGSASIGIVNLIIKSMEIKGIPYQSALEKFWLVDSKGLITNSRDLNSLDKFKVPFIRKNIDKSITDLVEIVELVKPTILLGVSGQGGIFNEQVIKTMASNVERPIVFALSNPTNKAECNASDAYKWTNGKVIFASGSPMNPIKAIDGTEFIPSQCNNMYVFPGIGLAAQIGQLSHIPDVCFIEAAYSVSNFIHIDSNSNILFPPLTASVGREISASIAADIILRAKEMNIINKSVCPDLPLDNRENILNYIKDRMWLPY